MPVTVYVVEVDGVAVTLVPVVVLSPAAGDHEKVHGGNENVMLKPPILPKSPVAWSITNNFHMPFMFPENRDSEGFAWLIDPGPGGGKLSGVPTFVHL